MGKNEVGLQPNEFLRESLSRLRVSRYRPARVDPDVAGLRPSELLQSLPESRDAGLAFRIAISIRHQHADAPHTVRLLRACPERPSSRRAAEKRDEIAPSHVLPSIRG